MFSAETLDGKEKQEKMDFIKFKYAGLAGNGFFLSVITSELPWPWMPTPAALSNTNERKIKRDTQHYNKM